MLLSRRRAVQQITGFGRILQPQNTVVMNFKRIYVLKPAKGHLLTSGDLALGASTPSVTKDDREGK